MERDEKKVYLQAAMEEAAYARPGKKKGGVKTIPFIMGDDTFITSSIKFSIVHQLNVSNMNYEVQHSYSSLSFVQ